VALWLGLLAAAAVVIGAVLVLALGARDLGARRVADTLEGNTTALATALRIPFERAVNVGLPLEALIGVEPMLREHLERHPEVSFFGVVGPQGQPLYLSTSPLLAEPDRALAQQLWRQGTPALEGTAFRVVRTPIQRGGVDATAPPEGWLLSAYPADYIDRQVRAVVTDLFVAVLIALVLALEILRFGGRRAGWGALLQFRRFLQDVQHGRLATHSPLAVDGVWGRLGEDITRRIARLREQVTARLGGADPNAAGPTTDPGRLGGRPALRDWADRHGLLSPARPWSDPGDRSRLRMVVFLTVLSDELVRPFLAVRAAELDGPWALGPEALAGIPLSAFLLTWALSQPFGAGLLQRFGSRRCLVVAAGAVSLLMLATAATGNWTLLVALRALTGVAFGFVLIFAQTLMLRLEQGAGRASALAEFVGAVVAAGICGPVIGGLMAVKLGAAPTLVTSGLCAAAALALAWPLRSVPAVGPRGRALSWASLGALLQHRRLLTLLLCSAIPGKLAATAVLLLVIPLAVIELGESPSLTGRLLLVYFLAFWLVAAAAGRLSDRQPSRKPFVVIGGLLSALGCAAGFAVDGLWGLVLLGGLLGLGQAWLSSPQIAWAIQMADEVPNGTDSEVVLGIYRLMERFGGALGPVLVAGLVGSQGLRGALLWLAAMLALGAAVTVVALHTGRRAAAPAGAPA
jgi:MFS family permease